MWFDPMKIKCINFMKDKIDEAGLIQWKIKLMKLYISKVNITQFYCTLKGWI